MQCADALCLCCSMHAQWCESVLAIDGKQSTWMQCAWMQCTVNALVLHWNMRRARKWGSAAICMGFVGSMCFASCAVDAVLQHDALSFVHWPPGPPIVLGSYRTCRCPCRRDAVCYGTRISLRSVGGVPMHAAVKCCSLALCRMPCLLYTSPSPRD